MNKKTVIIIIIFVSVIGIIITGLLGTRAVTDPIIHISELYFDLAANESGQKRIVISDEMLETPHDLLKYVTVKLEDGTVISLTAANVNDYVDFSLEFNSADVVPPVTLNNLGSITFTRKINCKVTVKAKDANGITDTLYFSAGGGGGGSVTPGDW